MGSLRASPTVPSWARALSHPYALVIRLSLAVSLAVGFSLGLYLLLGFALGVPLPATAPVLIQVHGQAQALGFVALFIMAVGVQLFPRFHATTLDRPYLISLGGIATALGIGLRFAAQPAPPSPPRAAGLLLSGVLTLVGIALAVYAFGHVVRRGVQNPVGLSRWRVLLPATMGGSLVTALLLNLAISINLARAEGLSLVPMGQDEALLHLELWGFAATMVLAVAGRVFPKFLILQPTRERVIPIALTLWGIGVLVTASAWLLADGLPAARLLGALAHLLGVLAYLHALRLYEAPARESGMPHVTNPTRDWARGAFGFLVLAAAINTSLALLETLGGQVTTTQISAGRHALAQGFILPVIVFMASRILPGYSGIMMRRPRALAILIWTLLASAFLRVTAELVGGYSPGFGALSAAGGALGTAAFTYFAIGLWRATGKAPSTR